MILSLLCLLQHYSQQPRSENDLCVKTDKQIIKLWYIHTVEYYSAVRKHKILPFATTWMELMKVMLSEIRQEKLNDG